MIQRGLYKKGGVALTAARISTWAGSRKFSHLWSKGRPYLLSLATNERTANDFIHDQLLSAFKERADVFLYWSTQTMCLLPLRGCAAALVGTQSDEIQGVSKV